MTKPRDRNLFSAVAVTLIATTFLTVPHRVASQQDPPCPENQTAGKTFKEKQLVTCRCAQSTAQNKPTYRVGAAPFGRPAALRVGSSARARGRRSQTQSEAESLYEGLEVPDQKDLRSPEVVGLRQRVLSARAVAWNNVEKGWFSTYRQSFILEIERRGYLNSPEEFFKAEPLKGDPQEYLKPEVYAEVLDYLRKRGHQFAALEREYQRLSRVRSLSGPATSWLRFDWREQGLDVGSVMQQGACESCWAFTAVSVYQSVWNLEKILTGKYWSDVLSSDEPYGLLDRFGSVQQLLNCIAKEKGNCESGGWHASAFAFMVDSHVPHIPDSVVERRITNPLLVNDPRGAIDKIEAEGYTGQKSPCVNPFRQRLVRRGGKTIVLDNAGTASVSLQQGTDRKTTNFDRALSWGYVNEKSPLELPPVAQLKDALIEHGPLAMPIQGDACFSVYQAGVFNGNRKGYPNHVMVLIGWDDEKQAWLIKNSWGEEWGEKGFGWVGYGSNDIGRFAAWIQPTPFTEVKER